MKACCADLYASDWVRLLLGESLHPGGLSLTERLGVLLGLDAQTRVLDPAAGRGTSALHLARVFGCQVMGVDYGARNVALAGDAARELGLAEQVQFIQADAERLSAIADQSFDWWCANAPTARFRTNTPPRPRSPAFSVQAGALV